MVVYFMSTRGDAASERARAQTAQQAVARYQAAAASGKGKANLAGAQLAQLENELADARADAAADAGARAALEHSREETRRARAAATAAKAAVADGAGSSTLALRAMVAARIMSGAITASRGRLQLALAQWAGATSALFATLNATIDSRKLQASTLRSLIQCSICVSLEAFWPRLRAAFEPSVRI
ncbi:hypothetical protein T492DRAFT_52571 [Pavlovales sp. CCMP2436]|nr:hypothetical protein T492DRAFT_52571 [Pavlovales sp. CCMP2436]